MSYVAKEIDVQETVNDFIKFCDYVKAEKPNATTKGDLSTKGCFSINHILRNPRKDAKPTDRMYQYPAVSLWFSVAKESGIITTEDAKGGKVVFTTTDNYKMFKNMNVFSQYMLIIQTWYCFVDIATQYMERGSNYLLSNVIDNTFDVLGKNGTSKWYQNDDSKGIGYFSGHEPITYLLEHGYKTACILVDLGLIVVEESGHIS